MVAVRRWLRIYLLGRPGHTLPTPAPRACWAGTDPAECILTAHHPGDHFGIDTFGQPVEWPKIDWRAEGHAWVAAGRPSRT